MRNPPGHSELFIGDELIGSGGVVVDATGAGDDVTYSVYLVEDGSLWGLRAEFLESAGELSPTDPLAVVDEFLGRSVEIVEAIPDVPIGPGETLEIVGVGVSPEGIALTYAIHVPPDGDIVVVDADEVRLT
ncbi:hypothetical protein ACFQ0M_34835 [Kitasatospora aburaviensis]